MTPHPMTPVPKPLKKVRLPKGLKRTRMRAKRKTPRRIAGKRNPALVVWIHSLPCHYHAENKIRQQSPTEASHMPQSRSFGDENNVWPLCAFCHRESPKSWHNTKRDWFAWYGGREEIAAIARQYTERFYREHVDEPA